MLPEYARLSPRVTGQGRMTREQCAGSMTSRAEALEEMTQRVGFHQATIGFDGKEKKDGYEYPIGIHD